jgi:uncharacterized protein YhaN
MRLRRLDLTRFGAFTDETVELPPGEPDFHLVVGPNEAGKSTMRAAISDLLFGIDARTPFNFVHGYNELRIGARLSAGDDGLEVVRLKRNKQPLRDPDDNPLPNDALAPYLAGADRGFFERMFGLDHQGLIEGGTEILHARDDVARMLFEASAGVASLGDLREALVREADGLWAPRKSKDRAYYQAVGRYDQARADLKEATFRASAWKRAKKRVRDAEAALQEASEGLQTIDRERGRLERIRRVAPLLADRNRRLSEREEMGSVVLLPPEAAADVSEARKEIAASQTRIARLDALIQDASQRLDEARVDEDVIAHADAIEALRESRGRVRDFPASLEKRRAEVRTHLQAVQKLARDLGWDTADGEDVAERIPPRVQRAEIRELLQQHGALSEAEASARRQMQARRDEHEAVERELQGLSESGAPDALRLRLDAVLALGDLRRRGDELRGRVRGAEQQLHAQLAELLPWRGDVEALRTLALPDAETVEELARKERDLGDRVARLDEQLDATRAELEDARLQERQFRRSHAPVSHEVLTAAREARDETWARIRSGVASVDGAAGEYEGRVREADELSDRRYREAGEAKELEHLQQASERLEGRVATLTSQREDVAAEREALQAGWLAKVEPLGLGDMTMGALREFREQRKRALAAHDALSSAQADLETFEASTRDELDALAAALAAARDEGEPAPDADDPRALVDASQRLIDRVQRERTRREQLARQLADGQAALSRLSREAGAASEAMDDWRSRWQERLKAAHLPGDMGPDAAAAALEVFEELSDRLKDITTLRRDRIDTMRRDLDAFAAEARALAERLAPQQAQLPPDEVCTELVQRLADSRKAQDQRRRAEQELRERRDEREAAVASRQEAHQHVDPLMRRAGVEDLDALVDAIQASDRRRALDTAIEENTRQALESGDGLELAALTAEVQAEDPRTLPGRLSELEEQRREAAARRDACLLEKQQAEAERDRVSGQADAASAAARAEEALSEMGDAVERYLKVFVGAELLRWAIDRYREEKQAPLLRRASEIFAALTLDSFARLSVDYEGERPQLMGVRPDGQHVPVDGMSEATRDQLFMALRLSAVELHLESAQPLPFIADDLFINYDDVRSQAGFRVLGQLARQTQVIFLTHHDHLLPLAREVLGDHLNVISLTR